LQPSASTETPPSKLQAWLVLHGGQAVLRESWQMCLRHDADSLLTPWTVELLLQGQGMQLWRWWCMAAWLLHPCPGKHSWSAAAASALVQIEDQPVQPQLLINFMEKFKMMFIIILLLSLTRRKKICSTPSWLVPHLYGLFAVIYLRICLLSSILNKSKHLKSKWLQLFDVA